MEAIRALPGGAEVDLASPPEIREVSLAIFDRSFAVTYAMEAVAVLVGLFGLSSSLGAIVLARRREFGVLRHLGVTRSQIRAMLAAEGGLLALIGAAAGLVAGGAISLVLVYVVNRQSFNWSTFTVREGRVATPVENIALIVHDASPRSASCSTRSPGRRRWLSTSGWPRSCGRA